MSDSKFQLKIFFVFLLFPYISLSNVKISENLCPPDISPCTCINLSYPDNGIIINCEGKDFKNGQDLKSKLSPPFPNDPVIFLHLNNVTFPLPRGLLGPKRSQDIHINCIDKSSSLGPIDPQAFEGVYLELLTGLTINSCNLTETNFEFLQSFSNIPYLYISSCDLKHFNSFPMVPTLNTISLNDTPLEEWYPYLNTPALNDVKLDRIGRTNALNLLDHLQVYTNLSYLSLCQNQFDWVPEQIKDFPHLSILYFSGNPLEVARNGSLHFGNRMLWLDLADTKLSSFEVGAFQGNFSTIDLRNNPLITIDELIFKPLLQNIYQQQRYASILMDGTNFTCGCDIKWLVVDNRHLLQYLNYPICSDGTYMESLDPANFQYCSSESKLQ